MFRSFGMQHIGLTVPDMAQAVAFFERFFGGVVVLRTGALDVDDAFMARRLGVPGDRRIRDIQVLRCGNGTNLELFEYAHEDVTPIKRNSEIGGFHLAFQVDDCFAAAAQLRAAGIEVCDGPTHVDIGPMAGLDWVYFQAPWGQFMELVSFTEQAYEATSPVKAWSPLD